MTNNTVAADCINNALGAGDAKTTHFTLDEPVIAGYARQTITTESAAIDDANDRVEFDDSGAVSMVFGSGDTLSAPSARDYDGVLLHRHVTDDTDSIPAIWVEFAADITSAATEVTVTWNAEGIGQAANAL